MGDFRAHRPEQIGGLMIDGGDVCVDGSAGS